MVEVQAKQRLAFSRRLRRAGKKAAYNIATKGKQNMIIVAALVVLILVFTALNPNFAGKYNIVSIAQSLAPYAVLGLGVTFAIATGGIDLSIGTVCIASAVLAGKMLTLGLIPLWATIPVMIAIGTAFGFINGLLIAKAKLPAFIATLGTMMFSRGLSALIVVDPNIFYPTGTWFNRTFSNANGIPVGLFWVLALMLVCMYLMYKCKIGRYILSIGSNEEATRLSGINTVKYKILAYTFSGMGAGIAAIFWAASFTTVASATGNGMELDAIAGVYIGGTSAAGGVASVLGTVIGAIMLVVIRSGLNFVLARFNLNLNATYVTYVLTGLIVVGAVFMDVIKNNNANKVVLETPAKAVKRQYREKYEEIQFRLDEVYSDITLEDAEKKARIAALNHELTVLKAQKAEQLKSS
ncbi:ribose ABC transporter permease [Oscillospiraceae bacterium]|nr:ribose ABC transporter permease [Oscillospiraceae bacterium]BDF76583.1 ribose ABC transporter permease [Oscillospiraceae bacterium]